MHHAKRTCELPEHVIPPTRDRQVCTCNGCPRPEYSKGRGQGLSRGQSVCTARPEFRPAARVSSKAAARVMSAAASVARPRQGYEDYYRSRVAVQRAHPRRGRLPHLGCCHQGVISRTHLPIHPRRSCPHPTALPPFLPPLPPRRLPPLILPAPCLFHTTRKSIPASPTQAYPMWAQIVFVWALLCCGVSASLVSCWKFIEAAYE